MARCCFPTYTGLQREAFCWGCLTDKVLTVHEELVLGLCSFLWWFWLVCQSARTQLEQQNQLPPTLMMWVSYQRQVALVIELQLHLDWRRTQEGAAAQAQPLIMMM